MEDFKLFVFTVLFASTLISAVPHHRIEGEASILDDEIQRDSLSQQLIRAKKSVDSGEIEDVAEKKANNEIEKRSSQGSSALWAQTTLNDVEMDRLKNEEETKGEAERSPRQYCNNRAYPIDATLMNSYYLTQNDNDDSSSSSSRSASTDESTLGSSSKTFSLVSHQSLLPMVHQPITHGVNEALPIYKPVQQVVQEVIQPIQPVIQPVVHPVQPVIQPVYQQIHPIVRPAIYQPSYHAPMQLPAIHQNLPSIHQQHPLFPQHQLIPQHPLPLIPHTPLCPCSQHLLGASRSAEADSSLQDQAQDPQQQLQSIALFRDVSQFQQDSSGINGESSFITNLI